MLCAVIASRLRNQSDIGRGEDEVSGSCVSHSAGAAVPSTTNSNLLQVNGE